LFAKEPAEASYRSYLKLVKLHVS